jgi:hypothetical protein
VNLLTNIIEKVGFWTLRKAAKNQTRQKTVHNFESANSIGLLFDGTNEEHFESVQEFYGKLIRYVKTVKVLGFSRANDLPNQYLFKKNFTFYQKKDLNWYHKPINPDVDTFINRKFDILIDLTMNRDFHYQYIVANNPSRFKVGRNGDDNKLYDLMINLKDNDSIDYFIEQIYHYLNIINKPHFFVTS